MVAIPVAQRFAPLIDEQVRIKKLEREQVVRLRYEINYAGRTLTDDLARKLCRVALVNGHDAVLIGDERCEALRDFRAAAKAVAAFNGLTFESAGGLEYEDGTLETEPPAGDEPEPQDDQATSDEPEALETEQPAGDEPEPQDDQATSDEPEALETEPPAGEEP